MPPTKLGTLVVVVLKARNLPNPGLYKQSPYILARLGGGGRRTKADVKGGQHPVWDEDLHFEIYPQDRSEPRVLRLTCFIAGKGKLDESIGEGELAVEDVLKNGEFDGWIPLSHNGTQRGEVYIELTFFLNAQALGRRPSKLSPAERLYRPSPPPSPGGPAGLPSPPRSNVSSPGNPPLSLPPRDPSPSAMGGRTPPLNLPPRSNNAPIYNAPSPPRPPPPQIPSNPPVPEYYDPFRIPALPPRQAAQGVPEPPRVAEDDPGHLPIPANLRPGPPNGPGSGIPYLDAPPKMNPGPSNPSRLDAPLPPPPHPSTAPPLPHRNPAPQTQRITPQQPVIPPNQQPQVSGPVPSHEREAMVAQQHLWEEHDRRKKQEEEDAELARQLMLEEEESVQGTNSNAPTGQNSGNPVDRAHRLPGGWDND